jgi:manganese transport protein
MAGQIVMEGFLGGAIRLKPWVRRLVTRLLAIGPALVCIIIYGESGLNNLLILSQIILSLQLPFAVWPLVYFTCSKSIMTLKFSGQRRYSQTEIGEPGEDGSGAGASNAHLVGGDVIALDDTSRAAAASLSPSLQSVDYSNNRTTAFFAIVVASLLTIFNIILLVQVAIGQAG